MIQKGLTLYRLLSCATWDTLRSFNVWTFLPVTGRRKMSPNLSDSLVGRPQEGLNENTNTNELQLAN